MDIAIRNAEPRDALHVAALVDIAGHGIDLELWLKIRDHDHSVMAAARRLVLEDAALPYHYSRAYMLEVEGQIAGCLVGGVVEPVTEPWSEDREYIQPLVFLETRIPGFWSILAVALYAEYRGRGLAKLLLDHAHRCAVETGATGLSIVVEDNNTAALATYKRYGFREAETRLWIGYDGLSGPSKWIMLTRDL